MASENMKDAIKDQLIYQQRPLYLQPRRQDGYYPWVDVADGGGSGGGGGEAGGPSAVAMYSSEDGAGGRGGGGAATARRRRAASIVSNEPIQPESNTAPAPAISDPSAAFAPTTRSRASKSTASSGNSSNSTLSGGAIMRMKIKYDQNFTACQGEAWKLPSGACVDDIVAELGIALIVIDLPTTIIDLFSDPEDKAALTEVLVKREGERAKLVSITEEAYLRLYDNEPAKIKEMLSQGWQRVCETEDEVPEEVFRESIHLALHHIYVVYVYRNNQFKLPEEASESFYLQTLWGFFNTLILCDETFNFRTAELCVLEAAGKDPGPNGSEAHSDTRKMAKWDRGTTITILTVIASAKALRKRVSDMAKQVIEWTTLSFELLDTSGLHITKSATLCPMQ
ncbi:hypothetical protein KI688_005202 [Linnemannia hyalina]|uniref:Uncharacterized protein n=1 Tax=Linnemannia hyalina TaxID=64524 RepID=A0A9P7XK77_9FUNG|nr:hypothetical protein KI688_005202 [Linnemannia hyalina]